MRSILDIILIILDMYIWVLVASAILSWLVSFNIVNSQNQVVATISDIIYRVTEPVLAPIRNRLPQLNGLDLSPIVVILAIYFAKSVIIRYIYPNVF
jgi:YggT family protein